MKDKIGVYFKGELVYRLNSKMVEMKGLTDTEIRSIVKLHQKKVQLADDMSRFSSSNSKELKIIAAAITEIEFQLQDLWKFEKDIRMHSFFLLPHCTCPKMDNKERLGTDYLITDTMCPIHGNE